MGILVLIALGQITQSDICREMEDNRARIIEEAKLQGADNPEWLNDDDLRKVYGAYVYSVMLAPEDVEPEVCVSNDPIISVTRFIYSVSRGKYSLEQSGLLDLDPKEMALAVMHLDGMVLAEHFEEWYERYPEDDPSTMATEAILKKIKDEPALSSSLILALTKYADGVYAEYMTVVLLEAMIASPGTFAESRDTIVDLHDRIVSNIYYFWEEVDTYTLRDSVKSSCDDEDVPGCNLLLAIIDTHVAIMKSGLGPRHAIWP